MKKSEHCSCRELSRVHGAEVYSNCTGISIWKVKLLIEGLEVRAMGLELTLQSVNWKLLKKDFQSVIQ